MKKIMIITLLSIASVIVASETQETKPKRQQKRSVNYQEWKVVAESAHDENEDENEEQRRLEAEHQRMIDKQEQEEAKRTTKD